MKPKHYNSEYDVIWLCTELDLNFNIGNVIKYIYRYDRKGELLKDLQKAKYYLNIVSENGYELHSEDYEFVNDRIDLFMQNNDFDLFQARFLDYLFSCLLSRYESAKIDLLYQCELLLNNKLKEQSNESN